MFHFTLRPVEASTDVVGALSASFETNAHISLSVYHLAFRRSSYHSAESRALPAPMEARSEPLDCFPYFIETVINFATYERR